MMSLKLDKAMKWAGDIPKIQKEIPLQNKQTKQSHHVPFLPFKKLK